jgi:Flp pilus assembly protein TadB
VSSLALALHTPSIDFFLRSSFCTQQRQQQRQQQQQQQQQQGQRQRRQQRPVLVLRSTCQYSETKWKTKHMLYDVQTGRNMYLTTLNGICLATDCCGGCVVVVVVVVSSLYRRCNRRCNRRCVVVVSWFHWLH